MVTQYTTVLDALPLWGLFPVIVVLVLAAIEGGYRLGCLPAKLVGPREGCALSVRWSAATAVGLQHAHSIVVGRFVQSLNEVMTSTRNE
jgi:hypothetical protein